MFLYRIWAAGKRKCRILPTKPKRLVPLRRESGVSAPLIFVPHQDDELLTLGVAVAYLNDGTARKECQIVLCTDGSASSVRHMLSGVRPCREHGIIHNVQLDTASFIKARDAEFVDSCQSLGIAVTNIHIESERSADGQLSPVEARQVIEKYLRMYPNSSVYTIAPSSVGPAKPEQHPDHRALGTAALELFHEGKIDSLFLFVEPYGVESFLKNNPKISLKKLASTTRIRNRLHRASTAYSQWSPENGRYAIGTHSVGEELEAFLDDPNAHFYRLSRKRKN